MPQVTIIIGVYNGELFLGELLESLHNQTTRDWKCIFVNDGSTDRSASILAKAAKEDSRITVLTQVNSGVGAARNSGLELVNTPFIMFADQDDRLAPQAVARAVSAITECGADILHFRSNRGLKRSIFVWEHIFRAASIGKTRFEPITGGEDTAFFWELGFKSLRWAAIDDCLYWNRPNRGSFSRAVSPHYIDNAFAGYRAMRDSARHHGLVGLRMRWRLWGHILPFVLSIILRHPRPCNLIALWHNLWKLEK